MRNTIFVLFGIWQFCSFACCDFVFASLVRNIIGTFFFSGRSFRTNCEPICGQLSGKRQTMFFSTPQVVPTYTQNVSLCVDKFYVLDPS